MSDRSTWTFPARVTRVVDGDTLDVHLDLGLRITSTQRLRLGGVDTAETYGVRRGSAEYARGGRHRQFVETWVEEHAGDCDWPVTVRTDREAGKYGRWIGDVQSADGEWLTDALVAAYPEVADEP